MKVKLAGIGLLLLSLPLIAEVKLSHAEAVKNALRKPSPEYSAIARQMRIQGDVEVEIKIAESGEVADVKVVNGNSMLSSTVVKALKEWKFTPFTDNGKTTAAVAILRFSFKQ